MSEVIEMFNKELSKIENHSRVEINTWCNQIEEKTAPIETPSALLEYNRESYMLNVYARSFAIEKMGFVIIEKSWIDELSVLLKDKKTLEIMCGVGAISKCLQDNKVDVIATDDFSWHKSHNKEWLKNTWCNIEDIDAVKAIEKYGKQMDYIIMSWAYMDDTAYRCLLKMREVNPNCKMIYIGEGWGGCTADDSFFDTADIEDIGIDIPQWRGIHDCLGITN